MTETDRVMNDLVLLSQAWNFAARRHASQRRKGEAQEPYINHLTEVAELVALATSGRDVNLVVAAALHDTVEDTDTEPGEIASTFNDDIAALVSEVTDDKRLDKSERKRMQVARQDPQACRQDLQSALLDPQSPGRMEHRAQARISFLGARGCPGAARRQPVAGAGVRRCRKRA